MENKTEKKKQTRMANRVLYIAVACVLCVGAVVGGILLSRRGDDLPDDGIPVIVQPSSSSDDSSSTDSEPNTPEQKVFVAPAVGVLGRRHDSEKLVFNTTTADWRVHQGIDITGKAGDEVYAVSDGVVERIWDDPMMGKSISISHDDGVVSVYQNLGADVAEGLVVGKVVKGGEVIACMGETAIIESMEEPHLHFVMTVGGDMVDPLDYISSDSQATSFTQNDAYEG